MTKKDDHLEYEIRIYNINEKKIKKILKENGAKLVQKKTIMPLITYTHPRGKKDSYIRIRDEGHEITMTAKSNLKSKYVVEREVVINNMEEGHAILTMLGCKVKYKIEKIREVYQLKGCKEIVFDSYAGIPTYMEIDCHDLSSLKKISKLLGYTIDDHDERKLADIYLELYGIPKNVKWGEEVTIKNGKKIFGPLIKKNKKKFMEILKEQMKLVK
jgi:predicted adenylyl cyclase CyaB